MNNTQFSIIIPTFNRPERLRLCLQSIAALNYSQERFEVVIVDDGSPISLTSITNSFETDMSLHLIIQENAGPASARNKGASVAHGQYLVFTDDDCQVSSNWLETLSQTFKDNPEALVGGHTINALPKNIFSTASQLLIDYLYSYYNGSDNNAMFFASNNFAMSRQKYQQIKGFDTTFPLAAGEDREFCDRWQSYGFPMHYEPYATVHHAHKLTLASFWKQHFNYGRGAFCFHQTRSKRTEDGIKVEPLTFYSCLLKYPITQFGIFKGTPIMGLLLLSQIANIFGFFWERSKN